MLILLSFFFFYCHSPFSPCRLIKIRKLRKTFVHSQYLFSWPIFPCCRESREKSERNAMPIVPSANTTTGNGNTRGKRRNPNPLLSYGAYKEQRGKVPPSSLESTPSTSTSSTWCCSSRKTSPVTESSGSDLTQRTITPPNIQSSSKNIASPSSQSVDASLASPLSYSPVLGPESLETTRQLSWLPQLQVRKEAMVAVNQLSLDLYQDEVFVLLGHNGAGKYVNCDVDQKTNVWTFVILQFTQILLFTRTSQKRHKNATKYLK